MRRLDSASRIMEVSVRGVADMEKTADAFAIFVVFILEKHNLPVIFCCVFRKYMGMSPTEYRSAGEQ